MDKDRRSQDAVKADAWAAVVSWAFSLRSLAWEVDAGLVENAVSNRTLTHEAQVALEQSEEKMAWALRRIYAAGKGDVQRVAREIFDGTAGWLDEATDAAAQQQRRARTAA